MEKTCTLCKETKNIEEFPKSSRSKDGYMPRCKTCVNKRNKEYRESIKEEYNLKRKLKYKENPQKYLSESKKYFLLHKDHKKEYDKIYRQKNKEKISAYKKEWEQKQRKTNPVFILKSSLRKRLNLELKRTMRGDKHSSDFLGCTYEEYKIYLEGLFKDGMSWENYGLFGWHIDHIKPCASFDLTKEEDQLKCFNYKNTQPLWWYENFEKGSKYEE